MGVVGDFTAKTVRNNVVPLMTAAVSRGYLESNIHKCSRSL